MCACLFGALPDVDRTLTGEHTSHTDLLYTPAGGPRQGYTGGFLAVGGGALEGNRITVFSDFAHVSSLQAE